MITIFHTEIPLPLYFLTRAKWGQVHKIRVLGDRSKGA